MEERREPTSDPWLAFGIDTTPQQHAVALRETWERFVSVIDAMDGDEPPVTALREAIAQSWRRSHAAGVAPTGSRLAPVVSDEYEVEDRWRCHPLHTAMPLIRDCVTSTAHDGGYLVVITDADGTLLNIEGNGQTRLRAQEMNFAEGTLWSESGVGTNGIGMCLATDHAVQVFGAEHFLEPVQRWYCSAAPVHDPDTGEVLGVVDLTAHFETAHPTGLPLVTATALAVEGALRLELLKRDARVLARHEDRVIAAPDLRAIVAASGRAVTALPRRWGSGDRLSIPAGGGELRLPSGQPAVAEPPDGDQTYYLVQPAGASGRAKGRRDAAPRLTASFLGRDRASVEIGGHRQSLRPRLGEILLLLSMHPDGLSPEALVADLHAEGGQVAAARVEVSRLRKLIGPHVESDHYRLTCDIATDFRRVEALLSAGLVRDAVELYPGPLLPRSDAPGVVRARRRLEAWVRHSVLAGDDHEALWRWLCTPGGATDLTGWKRMISCVPFGDTRRSECAARIGELRQTVLR